MTSEELLGICCDKFAGIGEVVVAGGCIRDELMMRTPKDWDVFVLNPSDSQFIRDDVCFAAGELLQCGQDNAEDSGGVIEEGKLYGVNVQIMAPVCSDAYALLRTFDWSICLFARTRQNGLIRGSKIEDIYPSAFMDLQTVTNPLSTLRRGFRFCDRYKVLVKPQDITRLCSEVIAQTLTGEMQEQQASELDVVF